ncbi:MAG: phosphodiester glycosidase family protein [Mycobacteriaceae bacterium]
MVAVASSGQNLGVGWVASVLVAVVLGYGALRLLHCSVPGRTSRLTTGVSLLLLAGLAATAWSYTGYLDAPGSAPMAVRTGDWMRDHHMNPIVDRLEQYLYAGTPPGNGKVAAAQLPAVGLLGAGGHPAGTAATPGALAPSRVAGLIDGHLRGEGQWTPSGRLVGGHPALYTTFVRPDPAHTNVVAAAVWLDPAATRVAYVPGTKQAGPWAWGSGIPTRERRGLIAAFNGGFKFKDTPGGYRTEGRTPVALVDGQASLVLHADGSADIGAWGSDVKMTRDVTTVRQNLALIVENGQPVTGLGDKIAGAWGSPRWQLQYTNRSGIGITRDHALVYVAGSDLNTASLGQALAQAGAVRAMELDIHADNPTFNFFAPAPGGDPVLGTKLTPSMTNSATRFLAPDQRDFFAVTVADPASR